MASKFGRTFITIVISYLISQVSSNYKNIETIPLRVIILRSHVIQEEA